MMTHSTRHTIFIALAAFWCLAPGAWAVESEIGFDYWNLSFYSPSRSYRLRMENQEETGSSYAEYIRTDRFGYIDNTFHAGYTGRYGALGWDLKGGNTPKAEVMYRQMAELILYLPSPGYRLEPFLRGNYRRYTPARVQTQELGLRGSPMAGWDATVRWGTINTRLLGGNSVEKKAGSTSYQLGYQIQEFVRLFVFQGAWMEFFDSGNPANPGEFSIKERGAGFWWSLDKGVRLTASYSIERRSNDTFVKKYSTAFQQVY
ncbi:MAG: hypothetical protein HY747_11225 [Elusimicrobia bacterium]|nr:hypothetical protein [Elusimicrobiota bacterium]